MGELRTCRLRPWREDDEAALVRHANDAEVVRWLRDAFPHPYTLDHARTWLACSELWRPVRHWAIEVGGEAVGGCSLEPRGDVYRRTWEIGYWLGRQHWGRGIASEVVAALSDEALANPTVSRLEALVFAGNLASARVLEKAGFALESVQRQAVCKQGALLDQWLYVRLGQSF
jgi:RimJ/RimL family protein N-acetyltransferase